MKIRSMILAAVLSLVSLNTYAETINYESGAVYVGEVKNGQPHGQGKFKSSDGSSYEGQWKSGKWDGQGIFRSTDGSFYKGQWRMGAMHGRGRFVSKKENSVAEGIFKDNQIWTGQKKQITHKGETAIFPFKNGKLHGEKKVIQPQGFVSLSQHYRNGVAYGTTTIRDENGKLVYRGKPITAESFTW